MLELKNINYRAGGFALDDISLAASRTEYFVLLGPTGSGKTLILKTIAGLIPPLSGNIIFDGNDITRVPPEDRGFGYVAQDYRLFPHLGVSDNILFSPEARNLSVAERKKLLDGLTASLEISDLLERSVRNLSGGERQRVALARTLASKPRLVLLDEPFSAIDEGLKKLLWFEIKNILAAAAAPVVHVTHDIEEAVTLADKIAVIIDGKICQSGTPDDILLRPASERIARYLGITNIYRGRVISSGDGLCATDCSGLKIVAPAPDIAPADGSDVSVCVRPQSVKIIRDGESVRDELIENLFDGEVVKTYFFSDTAGVFIRCGRLVFEARFPHAVYHRNRISVGKNVRIALWRPDVMIYS